MCVCVGQGSKHAAVCRPAVPVNGGTADDATAADGGGPEVAGAGGKAAGNTLRAWKYMHRNHMHTQLTLKLYKGYKGTLLFCCISYCIFL